MEQQTPVSVATTDPKWFHKPTNSVRETPEGYSTLSEGAATVIFQKKAEAFYNEAQEANRDLSLLIIQQVIDELMEERGAKFNGVTIFEGLSASGLRAIRYWKELYGVKQVIANDLDSSAVDVIKRNVEHNNISVDQVVPHRGDASQVMYTNKNVYDVIDLDPYGSVATFVDSAVQSVTDGGLLCVTSTDMQVLCGNYAETCFYKYGGFPLRGKITHETAVRLVLGTLERSASRYKRYIVPVACIMMDFYVRLYVRVYTSAEIAKDSCIKQSQVYECTGCSTHFFQPLGHRSEGRSGQGVKYSAPMGPPVGPNCPECNRPFKIAGPIWNREMCHAEFLKKALQRLDLNQKDYRTFKKINGHLSVLAEELPDVPLFYDLSELCKLLHMQQPSMRQFIAGLHSLNKGYRISVSHTDAKALKTDAPASVIWDMLRTWQLQYPVKRIDPSSAAAAILAKPPSLDPKPDFTPGPKIAKVSGKPRFSLNPPCWGPGKRGTFNINSGPPDRSNNKKRKAADASKEGGEQAASEEKDTTATKEGEEEEEETTTTTAAGAVPPETKRSRTEAGDGV